MLVANIPAMTMFVNINMKPDINFSYAREEIPDKWLYM